MTATKLSLQGSSPLPDSDCTTSLRYGLSVCVRLSGLAAWAHFLYHVTTIWFSSFSFLSIVFCPSESWVEKGSCLIFLVYCLS